MPYYNTATITVNMYIMYTIRIQNFTVNYILLSSEIELLLILYILYAYKKRITPFHCPNLVNLWYFYYK